MDDVSSVPADNLWLVVTVVLATSFLLMVAILFGLSMDYDPVQSTTYGRRVIASGGVYAW